MTNFFKKIRFFIIFLIIFPNLSLAEDLSGKTKTKFYNFDDLLINGEYKKPQILYTDSKQKVRFEKLLKLKKDFLFQLKKQLKTLH